MAQFNQLSNREREVIGLLLQGKSNKLIAASLGISERTVEFHLKNIYNKYQVSSRLELILKLGNSTGKFEFEDLGSSTVDHIGKSVENRDAFNTPTSWATFYRDNVSIIGRESKMKNRWKFYFWAGLIFGISYWHYLSLAAKYFSVQSATNSLGNGWLFLVAMLTYFSVWLIPATVPAIYEYHHSTSLQLSVMAVITMWLSAVLGYYLNYLAMYAIIGLPGMEYLLIFGQRTSDFWQTWPSIFFNLILFKFLKWIVVSMFVSGIAGLITSSVYSALVSRKSYKAT